MIPNMTAQETALWDSMFALMAASDDNSWGESAAAADQAVKQRRLHFADTPDDDDADEDEDTADELARAEEMIRECRNIINRRDQELSAERQRGHEFGAMLSDIRTFCLLQLKTHGLDTQQTTLQLVCELAKDREQAMVANEYKRQKLEELYKLLDAAAALTPTTKAENQIFEMAIAIRAKHYPYLQSGENEND